MSELKRLLKINTDLSALMLQKYPYTCKAMDEMFGNAMKRADACLDEACCVAQIAVMTWLLGIDEGEGAAPLLPKIEVRGADESVIAMVKKAAEGRT